MHTMTIAPTGTPGIVAQTLRWAAEELRQEASRAHLRSVSGATASWAYYTHAAKIMADAAVSIEESGALP